MLLGIYVDVKKDHSFEDPSTECAIYSDPSNWVTFCWVNLTTFKARNIFYGGRIISKTRLLAHAQNQHNLPWKASPCAPCRTFWSKFYLNFRDDIDGFVVFFDVEEIKEGHDVQEKEKGGGRVLCE